MKSLLPQRILQDKITAFWRWIIITIIGVSRMDVITSEKSWSWLRTGYLKKETKEPGTEKLMP